MEPTGRSPVTMVPVLHCVNADATTEFFTALGFETTYSQRKPYLYLAFVWDDIEIHFGSAPASVDVTNEETGGCLVMADQVATYHAQIVAAMRKAYGKVLGSGLPRVTRFRPGASRFTLMDPSGNAIIFIQRDEPEELEYGGSTSLIGLANALDNARILREFKNDDLQAFRALKSAIRRHAADATVLDRARALVQLSDLAQTLEESATEWEEALGALGLSEDDRQVLHNEFQHLEHLSALVHGGDESDDESQ